MTLKRVSAETPAHRSGVRKSIMVAVLSLVIGLFALAMPASAQAAPERVATSTAAAVSPDTASGCTTTGLGLLCATVFGKGLYVSKVHAGVAAIGWVCNKQFKVTGTLKTGKAYSRTVTSKCGLNGAFINIYPKKNFKNKTRVCAAVRNAGGTWSPYRVCEKIEA